MVNKDKYTKTDLILAIRGDPAASEPEKHTGDNAWIENTWLDDERKSSNGHIPTIAFRLNCSDQTVRNYLAQREKRPEYRFARKALTALRSAINADDDRELLLAFNDLDSLNVDDLFGIDELLERFYEDDNLLLVKKMATAIEKRKYGGLTRQAVDLQAAIAEEKKIAMLKRADHQHQLITDAELALHVNIKMFDTPSIRFALERLDKGNYASRTEMTGPDGMNLYDDDARNALAEMAQLLDDDGKNPSEAIIDALHKYKAKRIAHKDKGKDNSLSMRRGEADG